MTTTSHTPSTSKVRRDVVGGKRGEGLRLQREERRIRRPDPHRVHVGADDPTLTGVGGLVEFGRFLRDVGVDRELRETFGAIKRHPRVVYPMAAQLRLFIDLQVAGEPRIFGLESLAGDALFRHLAGGHVPSIDTLYDDFARFGAGDVLEAEALVAAHGLELVERACDEYHVDVDTTVTPLFGEQVGAFAGPNPRYRGRPSYHPLLVRVAEADAIIGGDYRDGDTSFGGDDTPTIVRALRRLRRRIGGKPLVYVRIDAAGDCTQILSAIEDERTNFVVKARMTPDLVGAIAAHETWTVVDRDADGTPIREVANVPFARGEWTKANRRFRVVVVRVRDRHGKQIALWDSDCTAQAYVTNDHHRSADDLARKYDARAGIEPTIGELKYGFWIGKAPTGLRWANAAAFMFRLLAFNLVRQWVRARHPRLRTWRVPWIRRALITRPGRLTHSGRSWTLRLAPRRMLN